MAHAVHKKIDIVGTSPKSLEDAIQSAIAAAHKTVRNTEWFEVEEIRGRIQDGQVEQYQVTLKIGFKVEV